MNFAGADGERDSLYGWWPILQSIEIFAENLGTNLENRANPASNSRLVITDSIHCLWMRYLLFYWAASESLTSLCHYGQVCWKPVCCLLTAWQRHCLYEKLSLSVEKPRIAYCFFDPLNIDTIYGLINVRKTRVRLLFKCSDERFLLLNYEPVLQSSCFSRFP